MSEKTYDIIVIGAGSAGLSVGLFLGTAGFKVLMIDKQDKAIGGECLNDGCVPTKALIHVAKIVHAVKLAQDFGWQSSGETDMQKVMDYITGKQELIREHENADWLRNQGVDVELGEASFSGKHEVAIGNKKFSAKKIVIATGSKARKLVVAGIELVNYFDNENIFRNRQLPRRLLIIGSGPIGIEMAQAFSRLGSQVTVIDKSPRILKNDDQTLTAILLDRLQKEGIVFHFNAAVESFTSANTAIIKKQDGSGFIEHFDAVFVGIGRELQVKTLNLSAAGILISNGKIVSDSYLRTSNKAVFVCGDIAGDLKFSHAAEFQARIILNNLFSPLKKKLSNDHMSWVTFTDPELATFGLNEKALKERAIKYVRLEERFEEDDRAVVDDHQYGKIILFISRKSFFKKQKILGGAMLAPNAGELVQELILANVAGISIDAIFNKIYPYPVAARINQKVIVGCKQQSLTPLVKKLLRVLFKIIN